MDIDNAEVEESLEKLNKLSDGLNEALNEEELRYKMLEDSASPFGKTGDMAITQQFVNNGATARDGEDVSLGTNTGKNFMPNLIPQLTVGDHEGKWNVQQKYSPTPDISVQLQKVETNYTKKKRSFQIDTNRGNQYVDAKSNQRTHVISPDMSTAKRTEEDSSKFNLPSLVTEKQPSFAHQKGIQHRVIDMGHVTPQTAIKEYSNSKYWNSQRAEDLSKRVSTFRTPVVKKREQVVEQKRKVIEQIEKMTRSQDKTPLKNNDSTSELLPTSQKSYSPYGSAKSLYKKANGVTPIQRYINDTPGSIKDLEMGESDYQFNMRMHPNSYRVGPLNQ